ncbi:MAG TPA: hypothetical protein VGE07_30750 [Herpetosiphonaceae bacterium]
MTPTPTATPTETPTATPTPTPSGPPTLYVHHEIDGRWNEDITLTVGENKAVTVIFGNLGPGVATDIDLFHDVSGGSCVSITAAGFDNSDMPPAQERSRSLTLTARRSGNCRVSTVVFGSNAYPDFKRFRVQVNDPLQPPASQSPAQPASPASPGGGALPAEAAGSPLPGGLLLGFGGLVVAAGAVRKVPGRRQRRG